MKRAAVITAAGTSSRFSQSLGREVCKVIFSEGDEGDSLLARQLELLRPFDFDLIVVVGGHLFDDLSAFLERRARDLPLRLVRNERYADYGTCHSLAVGLEALDDGLDQVLFLEGDLLFDAASLGRVMASPHSVVTATGDLIRAEASVAFYLSEAGDLRYIYDTEHKILRVPEPFRLMANSGQVWKFGQPALLRQSLAGLTEADRRGTNLIIIADYFSRIGPDRIDFIKFDQWANCNTIEDHRAALAALRGV